jgi:hypothetical protein
MASFRVPILLVACCWAAGAAAASEPRDAALAADAAFAAMSLERGQPAAFRENLAADGVIFRPGAVNGPDWLAVHEQASGRLEWTPTAGAAACDGRLAITTGPWHYSNPESGDVAAGHYLSIWRRDIDGRWRVVLDHGVDHAPAATPPVALPAALAVLWPEVSARACRTGRWSQSLEEAERRLDDDIRSEGMAAALRRAAADGALAYRDDAPPGELATLATSTDAAFSRGSEAGPQRVSVEPGSNMGYSYGEITAPAPGPAPSARAIYVRIWQGDGRRWRLAVDMVTLLPAADGP